MEAGNQTCLVCYQGIQARSAGRGRRGERVAITGGLCLSMGQGRREPGQDLCTAQEFLEGCRHWGSGAGGETYELSRKCHEEEKLRRRREGGDRTRGEESPGEGRWRCRRGRRSVGWGGRCQGTLQGESEEHRFPEQGAGRARWGSGGVQMFWG
ncbi:unnamed protein product [Natator depressus]